MWPKGRVAGVVGVKKFQSKGDPLYASPWCPGSQTTPHCRWIQPTPSTSPQHRLAIMTSNKGTLPPTGYKNALSLTLMFIETAGWKISTPPTWSATGMKGAKWTSIFNGPLGEASLFRDDSRGQTECLVMTDEKNQFTFTAPPDILWAIKRLQETMLETMSAIRGAAVLVEKAISTRKITADSYYDQLGPRTSALSRSACVFTARCILHQKHVWSLHPPTIPDQAASQPTLLTLTNFVPTFATLISNQVARDGGDTERQLNHGIMFSATPDSTLLPQSHPPPPSRNPSGPVVRGQKRSPPSSTPQAPFKKPRPNHSVSPSLVSLRSLSVSDAGEEGSSQTMVVFAEGPSHPLPLGLYALSEAAILQSTRPTSNHSNHPNTAQTTTEDDRLIGDNLVKQYTNIESSE